MNPSLITIDGSQGEGGGQVLRTSLTLSALTGRPLRLVNIRTGRSRPGLRPQHLTAVRAVAAVCAAQLQGDKIDSQTLEFHPTAPPRVITSLTFPPLPRPSPPAQLPSFARPSGGPCSLRPRLPR